MYKVYKNRSIKVEVQYIKVVQKGKEVSKCIKVYKNSTIKEVTRC